MGRNRTPSNGANSVPYVSSDPNRTGTDNTIAGKDLRIDAALKRIFAFLRDVDPNPTLDRLASYLGARSVLSLDTRTTTKYILALANPDAPDSPLVVGPDGKASSASKPSAARGGHGWRTTPPPEPKNPPKPKKAKKGGGDV